MHFSSQLLLRTSQATLLFLVLAFQGVAQAPPFAWANRAGGTDEAVGTGIAVDASGNSYVTGDFLESATFGNITLNSSGSNDMFIAKYDASGNVLWAQKAGGTGLDLGYSIALDGSGNSYVTGSFQGTANFGSTTLISSNEDVFIAKYDTSGNVLWAQKTVGGAIFDIALDGSGPSYVTGSFMDTATFGNITLISSGYNDIFIARLDASGNVLWVQQAGGTGFDVGQSIALDGSGNSYVTGFFNGTATFGSTTLSSNGSSDVFIAKYDASGNMLWAHRAGGTNGEGGYGIALDGSGNSYVTGTFNATTTFGSTSLSSNGLSDAFIAKYDVSGNMLWVQQAGGTGFDNGNGIALDGTGNSYVTGHFQGSATFGSTTLSSNGSSDVFIAKYNASGNALWAQQAGGTGFDFGSGIAVNGSGNSYVTGTFQNTATFGSTTLTSSSYNNMFLCKLSSTVTGLPSEISAALPTYPNPFRTSFQLSLPGSGPATVVLTDVLGREVHRQAVVPPAAESTVTISPAAHLPSGVYGLQIRQGGSVKQGKVMKE